MQQQQEETRPTSMTSSSRSLTAAHSASVSSSSSSFEWPTVATSYELLGKIGQGAFATVWKTRTIHHRHDAESSNRNVEDENVNAESESSTGISTMEPHECAIKVLNLDHVDSDLQEIRLEVQAMRLSSHANVLQCCTAFCENVHLWLVTPLMRKGSSLYCLQSIRRNRKKQFILQQQQQAASSASFPPPLPPLPVSMEDFILYIIRESLLGLQYIHDNGQIHRDIKAGNILLDCSSSSNTSNTTGNGWPSVKIADFGVSGWLVHAGSQQEKAKTFVGTPCWMAPEVMEQVHGYDYKADIWSLGITALELAKGYAPYANYPPMKVLILTIQEDPPTLDTYDEVETGAGADDGTEGSEQEEYSKSFRALVDLCLQKNPNRRPTCHELLQGRHLSVLNDESALSSRRQAIAEMLNAYVPDVGSQLKSSLSSTLAPSSSTDAAAPTTTTTTAAAPDNDNDATRRAGAQAGHSPVSIILSTEKDRPPGTTWVFADGSQVFRSSNSDTVDDDVEAAVNDVLAELDEFGKQTGGEHYYNAEMTTTSTPTTTPAAAAEAAAASGSSGSGSGGDGGGSAQEQQEAQQQQQQQQDQEEQQQQADDLNDFMDEFEMHTAGEDFRHPSK